MDAKDLKLYYRRWSLSFENHTATRRPPEGATSWYSLRTPTRLSLPNGREVIMKPAHRLLWHALVMRAYDLSVTPAQTMVSRESLSGETGLSADMIGECFRDLELLGWLRRKSRHNESNITYIFLTPHPAGGKLPNPQAVSVADEDMGMYQYNPAPRLEQIDPTATAEQFESLGKLLRAALPDHKTFQLANADRQLNRSITKCVKVAGSVHRCFNVLHYVLDPSSPQASARLKGIRDSPNLASFIEASFPTWFSMYPYPLPEIQPDDIEA